MPAKKKKKGSSAKTPSVRHSKAELIELLKLEQKNHHEDNCRFVEKIEMLQNALDKTKKTEFSGELQLKQRLKHLEFKIANTEQKLVRANQKAASIWLEKNQLQKKKGPTLWMTPIGNWVMAFLLAGLIVSTAGVVVFNL